MYSSVKSPAEVHILPFVTFIVFSSTSFKSTTFSAHRVINSMPFYTMNERDGYLTEHK